MIMGIENRLNWRWKVTHSLNFRIKVLAVKEKENLSFKKVAKRFHVGVASVMRWSKNLKPLKNRNKPATKIDMKALKKDIQDNPDSYQHERAQRFGVTQTGIWHAFKRLNVTYKKNFLPSKVGHRKAIYLLSKNQ